jgi:DNA-binding transcriptional regulator YiaG
VRTFLPQRKIVKKPNVRQYNPNPKTIGEHIRKKRIEIGLSQTQAAVRLDISDTALVYWEIGRSEPQINSYPAIISFLEYYPFDHDTETLAGKLRQIRHCLGLSYRQCAARLSVSEDAVKRWERGKKVAYRQNRELIEAVWHELPSRLRQYPL